MIKNSDIFCIYIYKKNNNITNKKTAYKLIKTKIIISILLNIYLN